MFISGREARGVLEEAGFSSRHARTALRCGLAGKPIVTRAAHLYDDTRVREVAEGPRIDWRTVFAACPEGIFVARRDVDVTTAHDELREEAASGWGRMSPWTWMAMGFQIEACGPLPFVASVAGLVVLGADIVGTRPGRRLDLAAPGPWFDRLQGGRLPMGPGQPWELHLDGPRSAGLPA